MEEVTAHNVIGVTAQLSGRRSNQAAVSFEVGSVKLTVRDLGGGTFLEITARYLIRSQTPRPRARAVYRLSCVAETDFNFGANIAAVLGDRSATTIPQLLVSKSRRLPIVGYSAITADRSRTGTD